MQDDLDTAVEGQLGDLNLDDLFGDGARHQENLAHREQVAMASSQQMAEMISAALQQFAQQHAVSAQQQVMALDKVAGAMAMLSQAFHGLMMQSAQTAAAVREMAEAVAAPRRGEVVRDKAGNVVGTVTRPM